MDSGTMYRVLELAIIEREGPLERPSAKHARLVEIYGNRNADLSPELAQRRSMLARYHTMLSKAALKRELLKANRNRQACGDQNADGSQLAFAGF
jgi:hypothetical protein